MGKVQTFTIILDRQQGVYMAGEVVTGRLFIRISERLKINSVKMLLNGFARVHWTEEHGSGDNRRTVHYSASESYLNFSVVFLAKQGDNDCYLEVGEWNYPFQVQLPPTLPTSFEHFYGRVRYLLNGHIDIPWAFDKHVNLSITVISPVDLNLSPNLRQPAQMSEQKTICCWCCKSDPIIATLSILKGGYVPGEAIVFNAIIDNKSSNDIGSISLKLIQSVTLHSTRKSRTWSRTVAEIPFGKKIEERKYEEWRGSVLTIPAVCSTSNKRCRIIDITYYVDLNVDPSGPSFSFDCIIPVTIGTVPLLPIGESMPTNNNYSHNYESSAFEKDGNAELDDKKEGEVTNMDTNYAPQYPYFKDFSIIPR